VNVIDSSINLHLKAELNSKFANILRHALIKHLSHSTNGNAISSIFRWIEETSCISISRVVEGQRNRDWWGPLDGNACVSA